MKVFNFQSVMQDKVYYLDKGIFLRKIVGCRLATVTMLLIVIYKIHLYNHFCRSIIRKNFYKRAIIRIFSRNYTFMCKYRAYFDSRETISQKTINLSCQFFENTFSNGLFFYRFDSKSPSIKC